MTDDSKRMSPRDPVQVAEICGSLKKIETESICSFHGKYKVITVMSSKDDKILSSSKCPKCQKDETTVTTSGVSQNKEVAHHDVKKMRIMKRNHENTLSNYTLTAEGAAKDDQIEIYALCQSYASAFKYNRNGDSLLFMGGHGTGKTHLAVGILKSVFSEGFTGLYTTASRLFSGARSTYSKNSKWTEDDFYNAMIELDLLVIDEIVVKRMSPDEFNIFFRVIDERYGEMKSTIFITNADSDELKSEFTDKIMDRLNYISTALAFNWQSYRSKQQKTKEHLKLVQK